MKIGILNKGDHVVSVMQDYIVVQRKNGEVDVVPIIKDEMGLRIDVEKIVTIGFGNNTVQAGTDEIVVTTF